MTNCPEEHGPCRHDCEPGKCNERAKRSLLGLLHRTEAERRASRCAGIFGRLVLSHHGLLHHHHQPENEMGAMAFDGVRA